jgi:hypothetical protein
MSEEKVWKLGRGRRNIEKFLIFLSIFLLFKNFSKINSIFNKGERERERERENEIKNQMILGGKL